MIPYTAFVFIAELLLDWYHINRLKRKDFTKFWLRVVAVVGLAFIDNGVEYWRNIVLGFGLYAMFDPLLNLLRGRSIYAQSDSKKWDALIAEWFGKGLEKPLLIVRAIIFLLVIIIWLHG